MKNPEKSICLILFLLFSSLKIQGQQDIIYITNAGKVNFVSEAPLEIIKAASSKLAGILNIATKEFVFTVPMNSFEGFNSALQRTHFNENYIESDKFPEAKFKGKIIEDINFNINKKYEIRAKGKFSIHGKENPMTIQCEITINKNEINIQSNFIVLLKDHDIAIPTVVNQKLAEQIKVTVKTVLKPKK